MDQSNVVLRYRDGRTERASEVDIDAERQFVVVAKGETSQNEVPFSLLKGVFFPRRGPDETHQPANGSTIAVEFADGEVIRGVANYNPERNGFFLYPHDRSKNDRVYVVNSAIVSIEVEKL